MTFCDTDNLEPERSIGKNTNYTHTIYIDPTGLFCVGRCANLLFVSVCWITSLISENSLIPYRFIDQYYITLIDLALDLKYT